MVMGSHAHQANGNATLRDGNEEGPVLSTRPYVSRPAADSWGEGGAVSSQTSGTVRKYCCDSEAGAKRVLFIPGTPLFTDLDLPI